jgi:cytochrome oxidase Cu insertion factor (SCO1/SenC/PrrC family)/copper(I)-binding protein
MIPRRASLVRRLAPLLSATLLAACQAGGEARAFRGVALSAPVSRPPFTLTDVNGQPFDFVRATQDKVALVFFGYTHCPDICPLHMANIAAVLKQMPHEERSRIVTIFVTTDPERDTPEHLKSWLANFDPSFVGLTGTPDELARVQEAFGLKPGYREYVPGADSANYLMAHAAQVFAFARDGNAYLIYPFGIRQEDWANDLPRLARDASGATLRRELAAAARERTMEVQQAKEAPVAMGGLMVTQAVIAEPPSLTVASAYLVINNDTPQADTLVAVAADLATRAEIHETMGTGEMRHMMPVTSLPLPPRTETRMQPGGMHIMLHELRRSIKAGDTVTLYLSLSRAGALEARATVVPYADLERALAAPDTTRR